MKDLARLLSGKMTPEERGRQTAIDRLMGRSGQPMQPAPPTPPTPAGEVPEPRQRTTSAIANALMKADDGLRRMTPPPLRQKVQDISAIASAVSPGADMVEMYQQAPQAYRAAREGDWGGAAVGALGTIAAMAGMGGESRAMKDFLSKDDLQKIIDDAINEYDYVGLRTVSEGHDPASPSRVWEDGEPIEGEFLSGVSVTDHSDPDVWSMHGFDAPKNQSGYYFGDEVYVIGGNKASRGQDLGEIIISDPVVIHGGRRPQR